VTLRLPPLSALVLEPVREKKATVVKTMRKKAAAKAAPKRKAAKAAVSSAPPTPTGRS
jgi:hypothetical protein